MNKQELIHSIMKKTGGDKATVLRYVDAVEQTIREALSKGEEVTLASTGKFKVKEVPAKVGRNPKTGESVPVPAKRKPVFVPAKALRDALMPAEALA